MTTTLIAGDPAEAVLDIIRQENEGWTAGDLQAYSRSISDTVTFTNIRGQHFSGRDAFVRQHAVIFDGVFKGTTLEQEIVSVQFIRPDVALVDTLAALSGIANPLPYMRLDGDGRLRTRLLQVMARDAGDEQWRVVAYHNVDVK